MKKSLLPLAVLGAFAGVAQAQTSVTVYGIIDAGVTYNSKVANSPAGATIAKGMTGGKSSVDSGNLQGSRLGFKGVEDLGGGLKAVFTLENGFSVDNGALGQGGLLFGRKAFVGLSGGFGTIALGRFRDQIGDTFCNYNAVNDFGAIVLGVHDNNLDRSEGARTNNAIRYDSPNLNGFTSSAIYGFGETAGSNAAGQSFGLTGEYANGPFGIGLGYYQSKLGATPSDTAQGAQGAIAGPAGTVALKTWILGANYQAGPARIYGSWAQVKQPLAVASAIPSFAAATTFVPTGTAFTGGGSNNNKTNVFDIGVNYTLNVQLSLLAAVQQERVGFVGTRKGKVTQFNLGTDYALSKRTDVYAFLANQRASNMYTPGIASGPPGVDNSQRLFTVGVRHKF